jgi:hypothetical protein
MRTVLFPLCLALVLFNGCRSGRPPEQSRHRITPLPSTGRVTTPAAPVLDGPKPAVALDGQPKPVFNATKLAGIDQAIELAIAEKKLPGGVLWLEQRGQVYSRPTANARSCPPGKP